MITHSRYCTFTEKRAGCLLYGNRRGGIRQRIREAGCGCLPYRPSFGARLAGLVRRYGSYLRTHQETDYLSEKARKDTECGSSQGWRVCAGKCCRWCGHRKAIVAQVLCDSMDMCNGTQNQHRDVRQGNQVVVGKRRTWSPKAPRFKDQSREMRIAAARKRTGTFTCVCRYLQ
jgi:hypothetical protein